MTQSEANAALTHFANARGLNIDIALGYGYRVPLTSPLNGCYMVWTDPGHGAVAGFCVALVVGVRANAIAGIHPTPEAAYQAAYEHRTGGYTPAAPTEPTGPTAPSATRGGHLDDVQPAPAPATPAPKPIEPLAVRVAGETLRGIFKRFEPVGHNGFLLHVFMERDGTKKAAAIFATVINADRPDHSVLQIESDYGPEGARRFEIGFYANDVTGRPKGEMFSHVESGLVDSIHEGFLADCPVLVSEMLKAVRPGTVLHGVLDRSVKAEAAKYARNHHTRRTLVYVCHPYSADPKESARVVASICRAITAEGKLPIAPQVYLGAFVDDETERSTAMELCLNLLAGCEEMRVYGPTLSAGMREEIEFAMAHGIRFTSVTGPAYDTFTKHDPAEPAQ